MCDVKLGCKCWRLLILDRFELSRVSLMRNKYCVVNTLYSFGYFSQYVAICNIFTFTYVWQ